MKNKNKKIKWGEHMFRTSDHPFDENYIEKEEWPFIADCPTCPKPDMKKTIKRKINKQKVFWLTYVTACFIYCTCKLFYEFVLLFL